MKNRKVILCIILVLGILLGCLGVSAETDSTPNPKETPEIVQPEPTLIPSMNPTSEPTMVPTIVPENPMESIPESTESPIVETKEYVLDGMKFIEEDTGLTVQDAIDGLNNNVNTRASAQLNRVKRLAEYDNPVAGHPDWISMFTINGIPAYCIEPYVVVILDGNGNGPIYDSIEPTDLSYEQRVKIGRIIWYGYGHPLSGNSDAHWLATQLLIWQIVAPTEYSQIMATLRWCDPADQVCATTGGSVDVSAQMDIIMNLVNNHDKVPSFADEWHGTNNYNLNWDETLRLTDTKGVIDWFNDWSEESHSGINIKKEGNDLLVDIDSVYYEGYNSSNGKSLTFKRKDSEYQKFFNGLLLWISGSSQKLMAGGTGDPSPQFTLSFKLNTADIDLRKLDEYYQFNNSPAGTEFIVGWYEDPETQYLATGGRDNNWTDIHDWNKEKIDDLTGQFNFEYGQKKYHPLMNEDGKSMRKFTVGADGILHIDGLLPSNKKWWIKEINSSNPYLIDTRVFSALTGNPGATTTMDFVNNLRDVTLEVVKQDGEDEFKKINGATYQLYEIAGKNGNLDLDKESTLDGVEGEYNQNNKPTLSYRQLVEHSAKLAVGESFIFNTYNFKITNESDNAWNLEASKIENYDYMYNISKTMLPADLKKGDKFEITTTLKPHGTTNKNDDTTETKAYEVDDIRLGYEVDLYEINKDINFAITSETYPTLDDLPKDIKVGDYIISGNRYYIKEILEDKVIVNPYFPVSSYLYNNALNYYEIPNARHIQINDEFSLGEGITQSNYKVTAIDPGKRITLDVDTNSYKMILRSTLPENIKVGDVHTENWLDWVVIDISDTLVTFINRQIMQTQTVDIPQWIAYEDVPETVEDKADLYVKKVLNPIYTVKAVETGIEYLIDDHEINQINEDGTYTHITDGTIPGYLDIIQGTTSNNGGACEDPYNTNGCPVGTIRTYTYTKNENHPYIGLQYDELETFLGHPVADLVVDSIIEHNGIFYTVKVPVDDAEPIPSITLSWNDGKEHTITLVQGTAVTEYIDVIVITKDYEILKATDKEILLTWNDAVLGKNTMSNQRDFKIRSYTDTETKLDLIYKKVPDVANLTINQTFAVSDQTYKVLFNDGINQYLIIEDAELNWYEITPSGTKYYSPMTYDQYIVQEMENGLAYKTGDTLQNTYTRKTVVNDEWVIEGIPYTLLESNQSDVRKKIMFPWELSAPFSWSEILKKKDANWKFSDNGSDYIITGGHGDVCNYHLTSIQSNETWNYCEYTLKNDNNEIPYEELEPIYNLEVLKPAEVTVYDFFEAFPEYDAEEGDQFEVKGNNYEAITVNYEEGSFILVNTETKETFKIFENWKDSVYETTQLSFIEKGKTIDLNTIFNKPEGRDVIYTITDQLVAKAEIADNLLISKDISRFTITMTDELLESVLDKKEIVITASNNGKGDIYQVDGLPIFYGITGNQYIRLTDPTNHNMALPFYSIDLFKDKDLKEKVATFKSNELGTIDISALAEEKYYYQNPISMEIEKVVVINSKQMEGQLSIDKLKWGRTYLACEVGLPEGYDYQDDVCHIFTMDIDSGKNVASSILLNKLRRLGLQVVKVDQDNQETLLNGAWFSVRDITKTNTVIDENEQSTLKSRLLLSDVPEGAVVGDTFLVWRAKENGKRTQYTIMNIRDEEVVVEDKDGNQYWIPVIGTNDKAPLLYSDITKLLPKLEVGDIFTAVEKEPRENMKAYQITALTEEDSTDVFGNPVMTIVSATTIDTNDSNKMPIILNAIQSTEKYPTDQLGKYVSGAIFIERTQEVRNEWITWPEILNQVSLATLDVGKKVNVQKRILVNMPAFTEVKGLTAGETYIKDGTTWNIIAIDDFKATVSYNGTNINIDTTTVSGAVETFKTVEFEVISVTLDTDGNKVAVTIKDNESGSTLYIHKDTTETLSTVGLPGTFVKVSDRGDMGLTIANGYTNTNGQLLFDKLADGTYYVQVGNEAVTEMKVAKGTIFLPDVRYGTKIEICETKSPLGYIVGNSCEVIVPNAEYTQDTVKNYKTNKKIIWWEEGGRRVRIRKMGQ